MPEKLPHNPLQIPGEIVPEITPLRKEEEKSSIFDIERGLEILNRIENGEDDDEEKKSTLQ